MSELAAPPLSSRARAASEPRAIKSVTPLPRTQYRISMVDLNNFSTFPTLAVGLLIATLRQAGHHVRLIVPLAYDVPASERERPERWFDQVMRRVHLSSARALRIPRDTIRRTYYWWRRRPHPVVLREVAKLLSQKPDVVLLSAYLQHYPTVVEVGRLAKAAGVKLLLGGPAFNYPGVAEVWRQIPGLTAIYAGEADLAITTIVKAVITGENLANVEGVILPHGEVAPPAAPLRMLDRTPVPDFTDFPWDRYRTRIVPLMTGRGCQWAKCSFCSDIGTVSGRTFRTRGLDSVLHEMREQSRRHGTTNFLFLDLKLNSIPAMFRGIAEQAQVAVPGAQWIGTVHVDTRADNGLSRQDLRAAAAGGMRRISFGLESGSQAMLDQMNKGCSVEANSAFIRYAHEAGLSVRCTMFQGYPGEMPDDLLLTARFLREHAPYIDRIRFNDFSIIENTPIWDDVIAGRVPSLKVSGLDQKGGKLRFINLHNDGRAFRTARNEVMKAVYAINRRKLRSEAQTFDGMM